MKRTFLSVLAILLTLAVSSSAFGQELLAKNTTQTTKDTKKGALAGDKLMYTTYFYTAGEAIVHGYEKDTNVRIISLEQNKTVWTGTVTRGETKNVSTGKGVFGFLSDKKASILVGTPSSCTAVGYWLRDENGNHRADHFYTELPSSISNQDARVLVWAWEDTKVRITNITADKTIHEKTIKAGSYFEMTSAELGQMNSNVLEFKAPKESIAVQVYYDQGFFVPSRDGRVAGKIFYSYVGKITEGSNDLNLFAYGRATKAKVTDMKTNEVIWNGVVPSGGVHSMRLSGKYVKVESQDEISVSVAPFNFQGYAEHHFAAGIEGTGIETDFLNTTSEELWLFSYFDATEVTVTNIDSGKQVWKGTLGAGNVQGVFPGAGTYRVKSSNGVSLMGGSATCGAEYSPAGGMFAIDEELLKVAKVILQEREKAAAAEGRALTDDERAAPLSKSEKKKVQRYIRDNLGKSMNESEVQQRMDSMVTY